MNKCLKMLIIDSAMLIIKQTKVTAESENIDRTSIFFPIFFFLSLDTDKKKFQDPVAAEKYIILKPFKLILNIIEYYIFFQMSF